MYVDDELTVVKRPCRAFPLSLLPTTFSAGAESRNPPNWSSSARNNRAKVLDERSRIRMTAD